jgi:hypothetical protein
LFDILSAYLLQFEYGASSIFSAVFQVETIGNKGISCLCVMIGAVVISYKCNSLRMQKIENPEHSFGLLSQIFTCEISISVDSRIYDSGAVRFKVRIIRG